MTCGRNIFDDASRAEAAAAAQAPAYGLPRLVPCGAAATGPALSYRCFSYDCGGCDGVDVYERACVCGCHICQLCGVASSGGNHKECEDREAYLADSPPPFAHPADGEGGNHRERSLAGRAT